MKRKIKQPDHLKLVHEALVNGSIEIDVNRETAEIQFAGKTETPKEKRERIKQSKRERRDFYSQFHREQFNVQRAYFPILAKMVTAEPLGEILDLMSGTSTMVMALFMAGKVTRVHLLDGHENIYRLNMMNKLGVTPNEVREYRYILCQELMPRLLQHIPHTRTVTIPNAGTVFPEEMRIKDSPSSFRFLHTTTPPLKDALEALQAAPRRLIVVDGTTTTKAVVRTARDYIEDTLTELDGRWSIKKLEGIPNHPELLQAELIHA